MSETYARLAAHFDKHHTDVRGGVKLTYLTGEQVIHRLNDVLGPAGWTFTVKEHGNNAEADEMWALCRLEATIDGVLTVREQFGSDKIQRSRSTGMPLDIGFDLKSAATDALKKCATLIGVGLYLSEKDGGIPQDVEPRPIRGDVGGARPNTAPARQAASPPPQPQPFQATRERDVDDTFKCVTCGNNIVAQTGEVINANQADLIRERYGDLFCKDHRPKKAASA